MTTMRMLMINSTTGLAGKRMSIDQAYKGVMEDEADALTVALLTNAGFDPVAAVDLPLCLLGKRAAVIPLEDGRRLLQATLGGTQLTEEMAREAFGLTGGGNNKKGDIMMGDGDTGVMLHDHAGETWNGEGLTSGWGEGMSMDSLEDLIKASGQDLWIQTLTGEQVSLNVAALLRELVSIDFTMAILEIVARVSMVESFLEQAGTV